MTVAVIGRGMIGAAAARHLAVAGHEVLLIGPSEPAEFSRHDGVFGSHYDEGRITRRNATTRFWADAAAASIARYGEIEAQSGIPFYTNCGALMAGQTGTGFFEDARAVFNDCPNGSELLDGDGLRSRFPYFRFPDDFEGLYEPGDAGHISPRRLVAAQTEAARRHGAQVIDRVVTGLGESDAGVTIRMGEEAITAGYVLVAAGGMTDHLLPAPVGLNVLARTVMFCEVDAASAAGPLAGMPSLVFRVDDISEPYLLPPIRYPDGRIYIKLGGDPKLVPLTTPREISDWFRSGGNSDILPYLQAMFADLLPTTKVLSTHIQPCMTSYTADRLPVIAQLSERIVTATGGNGAAAKSSDELGRRGAALLARAAGLPMNDTEEGS